MSRVMDLVFPHHHILTLPAPYRVVSRLASPLKIHEGANLQFKYLLDVQGKRLDPLSPTTAGCTPSKCCQFLESSEEKNFADGLCSPYEIYTDIPTCPSHPQGQSPRSK